MIDLLHPLNNKLFAYIACKIPVLPFIMLVLSKANQYLCAIDGPNRNDSMSKDRIRAGKIEKIVIISGASVGSEAAVNHTNS